MPIDGQSAWREPGLSASQRVDRFFNLIEHAVENGVPLEQLFSREHVKKFILFTLKESGMASVTIISKKSSVLVIGDPAYFTAKLDPTSTNTFELPDYKFSPLKENLDKLAAIGWLEYSVKSD